MDSQIFLSWNVRGASNVTSRANIRSVVMESKASFLCIQESNCQSWSKKALFSLGLGDNIRWLAVPASGVSRGILRVWNKQVFEVLNMMTASNWALFHGYFKASNSPFACFNIYAPQSPSEKVSLWNLLIELISQLIDIPVLLFGDFNCVLHSSEKENCSYRLLDSKAFKVFLEKADLMDVPLTNLGFSWLGPDNKKSMLDRALINPQWDFLGNWAMISLHRKNSDHKPVKLVSSSSDWGPKLFKFFNCWLDDSNLMAKLEKVWKDSHLNRNISARFKELREFSKSWNKLHFGNIHQKIKLVEKEQEFADTLNKDNLI